MRHILRIPGLVLMTSRRIWRGVRMYLLLPLFRSHGKNVRFDPDGFYSFENIILGSNVSLGICPTLMAAKSIIRIGNEVIFGPRVAVIGGNHNTTVIGRYMRDITEKRVGDDLGVVIEDDVWIGTQAVILHGVTVGRGSIVAAGSVVTKSIVPYSIVAGCPARAIAFRWDVDTIIRHEEMLYSPASRIPVDELRAARKPSSRGERL